MNTERYELFTIIGMTIINTSRGTYSIAKREILHTFLKILFRHDRLQGKATGDAGKRVTFSMIGPERKGILNVAAEKRNIRGREADHLFAACLPCCTEKRRVNKQRGGALSSAYTRVLALDIMLQTAPGGDPVIWKNMGVAYWRT
jgi:hypothetical protein